jgi:hypothetical protein
MGFSVPTVQNFLFCLTLETGGLICGWITAIFAAIGAIGLALNAIVIIIAFGSTQDENDTLVLTVLLVILIIYIIYLCIVCYAGIQLVRGTKNVRKINKLTPNITQQNTFQRNPNQMKLFLILMIIGLVLSFLQIFTIGAAGIASAIIGAIIAAYFFICIYSLYKSVGA